MLAGTAAAALLLDNAIETPPVGAGPLNTTVPVAAVPPLTLAGLADTEDSATPGAAVKDSVTLEFAGTETAS